MNFYSAGGDVMRRREEILRIVRETPVHSQDELLNALRTRGFSVTQPTLSRDLRELGLVKMPQGYVSPDAIAPVATFTPREHRFEQLVRDTVISAEAAMNLVVIKTPVAAAQPLASAIDATTIDGALGTIGGDDTIFIAFRTPDAAVAFATRIHELAGLRPEPRASLEATRRTRA
ncbi:MAG: arginine repressor [Thermoanaerobaculia bacterium]